MKLISFFALQKKCTLSNTVLASNIRFDSRVIKEEITYADS
jgi:hypothetical protein